MLGAEPSPGPAYRIVLGSRHAQATPSKCKCAQTGGGSILLSQPEPNTLVVNMGGTAVVGSTYRGSNAQLNFELVQQLSIVPLRQGVRPARIGMIGRVVGTLQVIDGACDGECCSCGGARQGPATASLAIGDTNVLTLDVEPSSAGCGRKLSVNHQSLPVESQVTASPGNLDAYCLTASFGIYVRQGNGVFYRHYAVADFDPAPQLDAFWADALKPFRAVPREHFGFTLVVRVVEDGHNDTSAGDPPLAQPH